MAFEAKSEMKSAWHAFILFILLAVIFNYPLFKHLHNLSGLDWSGFFLPWHKITRDSILNEHLFPLWHYGPAMSDFAQKGFPHFHNPQTSIITPFLLPNLLFGEVIGIKISWTLHLALGMIGVFLVSRYFNGKGIFNILPPIVFMLSGHFVVHFAAGHSMWEAFSWFPLSFYFFLKSRERRLNIIYSAVFIALMLYEGGQHFVIWTFMFFSVYTAFDLIQNRMWNYITSLLLILILSAGLMASKFLPMFELFHEYSPDTYWGYQNINDFFYALFGRDQIVHAEKPLVGYYGGMWWSEYGAYIGILPFLLGIIGIIIAIGKFSKIYLPLILTGIFFLILSLDLPHPINLWSMLHNLPVLKSQRLPSRFITLFIFVLSIMSGYGLKYVSELKMMRGKIQNLFPLIIILIVYANLIHVNWPVYKPALMEKADIVDFQNRPSAYLKYSGNIEIKESLPHRITFHVKTEGDNLLVLNQSYWPSWKTTEGKLIKYKEHEYADGQMAAVLGKMSGEVTLYYSPESFRAGIVMSLLTSILCVFILWGRSKRKL